MSQKSTETVASSTIERVSLSIRFVVDGPEEAIWEIFNSFHPYLKQFEKDGVRTMNAEVSFHSKVKYP